MEMEKAPEMSKLQCPKRLIFKKCKKARCAQFMFGSGECAVFSQAVSGLNIERGISTIINLLSNQEAEGGKNGSKTK